MRDIFIAGNWKMHKNRAEAGDFALALKRETSRLNIANRKIALCAPYLQLEILKEFLKDSSVKVGAQNVHFKNEGASTGEISDHLAGYRGSGDVEHLRLGPVFERALAKDAEARPPMRLVSADDQNGLGGDLVEGVGVAVVRQGLRVTTDRKSVV